MKTLQSVIASICSAFPEPKTRWKALKQIKWRLRGPNGEFVGLDGLRSAFVPESKALMFDGRDNEQAKLAIYQATLGPLTIELLTFPA